jgi:hypothetical protein
MITADAMIPAIKSGLAAKTTGPRGGCGRAYVCYSGKDRRQLNEFKKAFDGVGLRYIGKAYGSGDRCAYIGYDNGTGLALAQADAIADNLRALGLNCYSDAVGD